MALCLAARRGLVIDLLLPARSNHRLSDIARARSLRALAQSGARIWLTPGLLRDTGEGMLLWLGFQL
jgi:cardiolipin synthase